MKRRPWTSDDNRALRQFAKRHTRARAIARKLRRTEGAVRQRAFSMGLSLETRLGALA